MQCMTQPTGDLFPLPTNMGVLEEALEATPVQLPFEACVWH